ncbi:MAG: N-acetylneuraminic acid synthase [Bacteroidetes bacterium]|nr:MAG: N-acetylneuraminic acid synthase [Bacteroidota bacterium]
MRSLLSFNKPLFVAEISSNHNGDLNRCKELIDATAEAGCDGVKFQMFKIKELFSKEVFKAKPEVLDRIQWELKEDLIPELAEYSKKKGLLFSCTPFYLSGVAVLDPHVDFFKIASYELLWKELFTACASTGKPLVFSIGMCTPNEIESALNLLKGHPLKEILILHCNSAYPTPAKDVNLAVIKTLREKYTDFLPGKVIDFGWSDHTVLDSVMLSSVLKYDSKMVEFHIDLDGSGYEYKSGHCWLPQQIKKVISVLNEARLADGNPEIKPSPSELVEREWRADPSDGLRPLLTTRAKI